MSRTAFYTAIEAVNIARKYNVPVFVLSDQAIATRIEAFPEPDLEKFARTSRRTFRPVPDYKPYDLSTRRRRGAARGAGHADPERPLSHRRRAGARRIRASRRPRPSCTCEMTAKRRKKLQALAETLPTPKVYGPPEGNVLLVGWGSTRGPIREAVDRARAGGRQRLRAASSSI